MSAEPRGRYVLCREDGAETGRYDSLYRAESAVVTIAASTRTTHYVRDTKDGAVVRVARVAP
jgi:hypothetical protein